MDHRQRLSRTDMQDRILNTADELFRQFGMKKTTVADIAARLAVSPAYIYRFFPSKDAIIAAHAERVSAGLLRRLQEVVGGPGSATERLTGLVATTIDYNREYIAQEGEAYKLYVTSVEQNWDCVRVFIAAFVGMLEDVVIQGTESGEFHSTDPAGTALVLHDCLKGVLHPLALERAPSEEVARRAQAMIAFLIKALR
ncbi:MAG: TetR/AcrR family transcriptional regulator [Telmatospirillum sp.]|nr:TetR/AcrR family transcriptional regulator [Telmatospirillum sp.]